MSFKIQFRSLISLILQIKETIQLWQ